MSQLQDAFFSDEFFYQKLKILHMWPTDNRFPREQPLHGILAADTEKTLAHYQNGSCQVERTWMTCPTSGESSKCRISKLRRRAPTRARSSPKELISSAC